MQSQRAAAGNLWRLPAPGTGKDRAPSSDKRSWRDVPRQGYQVVQQNLETFLARMRESCPDYDPIPDYVEKTFRAYLDCGILAQGFARAYCESCGHGFAVAFSCKTRGLCPSCNGRRMAETAAHVIDNILPRVPIRQVVLTFPKRIRWTLHHDRHMVSGILRIFLRALRTTLCQHSPGAPRGAQLGAVTFLHRAGASLNLHSHFHTVVCDGVFSCNDKGEAVFYPSSELDEDVFQGLKETVRKRVLAYLVRHGVLDNLDADDMMHWDHSGFSLHGQVCIHENDREGQERLLRYTGRPPFALERFSKWDNERLVYDFQRPRPDGQSYQVFTAMDLMQRLADLIPPPRLNQVRYSGVLAPNAALRKKVVAMAGPSAALQARLKKAARQMELEEESDFSRKRRMCWALLMARVFEFLPLLCPRCSSPMKIVAFITEPSSVKQVLEHLELPAEIPTPHPPRAPPQEEMIFEDYFEETSIDWDG